MEYCFYSGVGDRFGNEAVQHERAPRGQPRRRLRSPMCHGPVVGGDVPPLCCPAPPPLVSPLRDLCWSAPREPAEPAAARTTAGSARKERNHTVRATSSTDAVPSSTTEEANGIDDQAPDSASTQRSRRRVTLGPARLVWDRRWPASRQPPRPACPQRPACLPSWPEYTGLRRLLWPTFKVPLAFPSSEVPSLCCPGRCYGGRFPKNPDVRAREAEALREAARRRRQDPAVRERDAEACRLAARRRRRQDPSVLEREAQASRQGRENPAVREAARLRREEDLQNVGDSGGGEKARVSAGRPRCSESSAAGVQETAAKLLFCSLRWIRSVPAFAQLCCRDQLLLLEASWSDVFLLSAAQWGFPLVTATGVESAAGEGGSAASGLRGLQAVREAVARLQALHTDAAEYSCLKALALFRPEVSGLREAPQVERVQEQTLSVLLESSDERPRQHQQHRAARLLLLLGSLRAVPATLLEEAYFRPTIGPVPIERILCDVLQTL
ncbi:hypothetical protein HPB51_012001 [Rhipicephalus microplus]|uniref:NR LBD domain-containing protein n=1 Tax=Rhipicephalus microplus TaxID=6941 RepID=A0A9J6F1I8_RHIMP|nr:hypothetical protein HPB51_012001 [Rhipicephalus microplus]